MINSAHSYTEGSDTPKKKKLFSIAHIRDLERQVVNAEITYSRAIEILNEMADEHARQVAQASLDRASERDDLSYYVDNEKLEEIKTIVVDPSNIVLP